MRIDKDEFVKIVSLNLRKNSRTGVWSKETESWYARHEIPWELVELFRTYNSSSEISAGAGTLFEESRIVRWNDDFPEALNTRLLIVGSAPNGDHITIDLNTGGTGYLSHEHDWRGNTREFFVVVSPSIGRFVADLSSDPPTIPEDYWEAIRARS